MKNKQLVSVPEQTEKMQLPEYRQIVIIGPQGSGKTWLANQIASAITKPECIVYINGNSECVIVRIDSYATFLRKAVFIIDEIPSGKEAFINSCTDQILNEKQVENSTLIFISQFDQYLDPLKFNVIHIPAEFRAVNTHNPQPETHN